MTATTASHCAQACAAGSCQNGNQIACVRSFPELAPAGERHSVSRLLQQHTAILRHGAPSVKHLIGLIRLPPPSPVMSISKLAHQLWFPLLVKCRM
jgi:hypothetical protein